MRRLEIIGILQQLLRDLLGDQTICISPETRRTDVPNWDSFAYITFIVSVESEFGVKFSVSEIEGFSNIGEIVSRLTKDTE